MIKLFSQGVIAALMVADTNAALTLLNDHHIELLDPLAGAELHAEFLYYAIKKANHDVIQFLLNLANKTNISVDVPFYNYCGDTPLGLALQEGLNDVVPSLLTKTDKNFALLTAVNLKNTPLVKLLLKTFTFKDRFLKYLNINK